MVIYNPERDALKVSAEKRGVRLSDREAELLVGLARGTLDGCDRLRAADAFELPARYPRTAGTRPVAAENPHNAWVWRCDVTGSGEGPLVGHEVALKDVIPVAGQPMTAGSAVLEGFTPAFDATVVTRVLDAGGRVTGIATTEDMCLSGASVSASTGQVRNPRDPSRSAGGSSSGVAALVASGMVDSGIGADQGGSIRIPSSLCGVYGLKPTYGLVPYTGCGPIDPSLDHLGPIAGSAEALARLLQAIAGYDGGLDPRQQYRAQTDDYVSVATQMEGPTLTVGLLVEGFDHEGLSDPDVDAAIRSLAVRLTELGHSVVEVSAPLHRRAMDVHGSLLLTGAAQYMIGEAGTGPIGKGFYDERIGSFGVTAMESRGDQLFASVKFAAAVGGYLWDKFGGTFYARAQNVAVAMRRQFDALLSEVDVLLMPTTCIQAKRLPDEALPDIAALELALDPALISNTCAFNHTGHPALSIPIPGGNGLPVGAMAVGPWFGEAKLLGLAASMERAGLTIRTERAK